jgi:CMP-N,N'-diacetyllegionaminic acid synthase
MILGSGTIITNHLKNNLVSYSVAIIGYGSIGQRHAKILSKSPLISEIRILSKQKQIKYKKIKTKKELKDYNPDYIVLSNYTSLHYKYIKFFEKNFKNKKILVEKPLFNKYYNHKINQNNIFVGYNLRFNKLLNIIKKKISKKKLWSVDIFCGSYLPSWRKNKKYYNTSSAKKKYGGGVLLDLSHELDYATWLLGEINIEFVKNKKFSDLKIDVDDYLILVGNSKSTKTIKISLNYFTKDSTRTIIIDGKNISIKADLVNNKMIIHEDGKIKKYNFLKLENDYMYAKQHNAILRSQEEFLCSYNNGVKIMKLIDKIKKFNE